MESYLKDDSYYSDVYDVFTIKDCLQSIEFWQKKYDELKKDKKHSKVDKWRVAKIGLDLNLYTLKGDRYERKKNFITDLREKDRIRQNKYDNSIEPQGVLCQKCGELMVFQDKTLIDFLDEPIRVLFFFECPDCGKRKGLYDNGEQYAPKPALCSKCKSQTTEAHKREGNIITFSYKCHSCGFSEDIVDDLDATNPEYDNEQAENKKLLAKYRSEFCLTDDEGQKYIHTTAQHKRYFGILEEKTIKQKDPYYQKATKLKKLSVADLEKLLAKTLEKEKYLKLSLDKPEMGNFVTISFTVQDADSNRGEYDSKNNLKKLVKKTLESTNWRLMSEGVYYRLGILSGRLKGYEREDDLVGLVGGKVITANDDNKATIGIPFSFEVDLKEEARR